MPANHFLRLLLLCSLKKCLHYPIIISPTIIIPDNRLNTLADTACGHNDESHNTGNNGINADRNVPAVLSQLAVVNKADKAHSHLRNQEGEAAGSDLQG